MLLSVPGENWRYDAALDPNLFDVEPVDVACVLATPSCGGQQCDGCTTADCCNCSQLDDVATAACANLPKGGPQENCEFDVHVTGDVNAAKDILYVVPPMEPQVRWIRQKCEGSFGIDRAHLIISIWLTQYVPVLRNSGFGWRV